MFRILFRMILSPFEKHAREFFFPAVTIEVVSGRICAVPCCLKISDTGWAAFEGVMAFPV